MVSFSDLKKNLKKDFFKFKKFKVAILADSASQLLHQALRGYGYNEKINFEIYEADYDQINIQLFDPASELYAFDPDFIFINKSSENFLKNFNNAEITQQKDFSTHVLKIIRSYYNVIKRQLRSKIIVNNFGEINDSVFGNFANNVNSS